MEAAPHGECILHEYLHSFHFFEAIFCTHQQLLFVAVKKVSKIHPLYIAAF